MLLAQRLDGKLLAHGTTRTMLQPCGLLAAFMLGVLAADGDGAEEGRK